MIKLVRDLRELVRSANAIAASSPADAPRWSLFLTNRSFIVLAVAVLLNLGVVVGVPIPAFAASLGADLIADHVVEIATAAAAVWALIERLTGKTRVVWNRRQAVKAVEEATAKDVVGSDDLSIAMRSALK